MFKGLTIKKAVAGRARTGAPVPSRRLGSPINLALLKASDRPD